MGIPTRHSGAPYKGGEYLQGSELEQDISSIYEEFNGKMDDDNFAPEANINGDKFLVGSIDTTRLKDLSIEGVKIADDAIEAASIAVDAVSTRKLKVGAVLAHTTLATLTPRPVTFGAWTQHFFTNLTTVAGSRGVLLIFSFELRYGLAVVPTNHTQMKLVWNDGAPTLIHQFHDVCRYTQSQGTDADWPELTTLIAGAYLVGPLPVASYLFSLELQKLVNSGTIETLNGSLTAIELRR